MNNYTDKNYSSVKISDGCLKKLNEIKSISSLLIFIASIKREGYSSVQVEYSFYNPNPESINQNIILSEICKNKNSNLRALSTPSESTNNENDVPINSVTIYAKIYLDKELKKKKSRIKRKKHRYFQFRERFL